LPKRPREGAIRGEQLDDIRIRGRHVSAPGSAGLAAQGSSPAPVRRV